MRLTRIIKRLFFILLLLPLIALPLLYFALQTGTGAYWLSQAISHYCGCRIAINQVNYSFATPLRIELERLQIGRNQQKLAEVERATIAINPKFINTPNPLDNILLENGRLDLDLMAPADFTLNSNWLQLKNVDLTFTTPLGRTELRQVNAGLSPWKPNQLMPPNSAFQLSAQSVSLNQLTARQLLIKGRIRQGNVYIDAFGADLPNGEITAQGQRNKQGDWIIDHFYLNRFRWQSAADLRQASQTLFHALSRLPALDIRQLDIINASLEGDRWALNEANLSLQNIQWQNGKWSAKRGAVNFSAGDVSWQTLRFDDPIIKLMLNNLDIVIEQASTRWQGGLIKTDGLWRHNKLTLNRLIISAIEYTLPENWRALFDYRFPDWLQTVNVDSLQMARSVIVDVNAEFPFQLTWLEANGKTVRLVSDKRLGLWRGELSAQANNATFNKVDLRHPTIELSADDKQIRFTKMNAFINKGLIDGQLAVSQADKYRLSLRLTGENVPLNLLNAWGWRQPGSSGNGNIAFRLTQEGRAHSVQARLEMTSDSGKKVVQTLPEHDALLELEVLQPQPLPDLSDIDRLADLSERLDLTDLPALTEAPPPDSLPDLPDPDEQIDPDELAALARFADLPPQPLTMDPPEPLTLAEQVDLAAQPEREPITGKNRLFADD